MNKKRDKIFIYLSFIISTCFILFLNMLIFYFIEGEGVKIFVFLVSLCMIVIDLLLTYLGLRKLYSNIVYNIENYKDLNYKLIDNFDIAYAVLDENADIVWMNNCFRSIFKKKKGYRGNIEQIFSQFDSSVLPDEGISSFEVAFNKKEYRVEFKLERFKDRKKYYAMYLRDITELNLTIKQIREQEVVVCLIYIDNYEELLSKTEEVRKSLLVALVERKINNYFLESYGIVKKLDKDKFIVIFKRWFLDRIKADRFALLEEVKNVNIGNEIPVTISMGIGAGNSDMNEANEYARIAMEFALGRGGDQCVVKDLNNISYYGGNTPSIEKNTRVKARIKAQALKEIMLANDQIIIMGHRMTDVDSLGAGMGIFRAARSLHKKAHIVINVVSTSIRPLISPFLNNPAYDEDMFIDSKKAMEIINPNTVVVVVDTNRPSYTECPELLNECKNIVVFDHHRQGEDIISNAILSYIETYASSASEMVAEMLPYFSDDIKLRPQEADCIYAGVVIDTNNFTAKTGARTFEAAAYLKRNGADVVRVRKMFRDDILAYQRRAEAISKAEVFGNNYAISICNGNDLESPNIVGAQAANGLLDIAGIKASFVLTNYDNQTFISARSIDEVNVQIIMERLGGGGHLNIAGAQLNCSTTEAKEQLKKVLKEMQEEGEIL